MPRAGSALAAAHRGGSGSNSTAAIANEALALERCEAKHATASTCVEGRGWGCFNAAMVFPRNADGSAGRRRWLGGLGSSVAVSPGPPPEAALGQEPNGVALAPTQIGHEQTRPPPGRRGRGDLLPSSSAAMAPGHWGSAPRWSPRRIPATAACHPSVAAARRLLLSGVHAYGGVSLGAASPPLTASTASATFPTAAASAPRWRFPFYPRRRPPRQRCSAPRRRRRALDAR